MSTMKEMRAVYTETLIELGTKNPNIVLLEADLMKASATGPFKQAYPDRLFNVGVAEANMVGIAAGLSACGKIPFADTFACFSARRTFDQFFVSANYARLNVKLTGTDPGIAAELNGGTHMPFEDIGMMRTIPKLIVFEPSDPVSLKSLVTQNASYYGCSYMRLHRMNAPVLYSDAETFELGKGKTLRTGSDVTLIATGVLMVNEALKAADLLAQDGIRATVIDMHTIAPIDKELVLQCACATGAIVTCENHQIAGGLGSAVAEVLSENHPTLLRRIGVRNEFGEVGNLEYLKERFGLTARHIREKAAELARNTYSSPAKRDHHKTITKTHE